VGNENEGSSPASPPLVRLDPVLRAPGHWWPGGPSIRECRCGPRRWRGTAKIVPTITGLWRPVIVDDLNKEPHGTPGALRMAMLTAPRLQLLFDQAFAAVSRSHNRDALDAPQRNQPRITGDEQVAPACDSGPKQGQVLSFGGD